MRNIFIDSYKNREVRESERISVYRNLHQNKLSLKKGSLVHGHAKKVVLHDVEFRVNKKDNQKVRDTKRKSVHAFVIGNVDTAENYLVNSIEYNYDQLEKAGYVRVYYNPYKVDSFVLYDTQEPVFNATEAIVVMDRVYIKA